MKKLALFFALALAFACSDDETESPTRLQLLTGGSQKAWYFVAATGTDLCPSSVDNNWVFFADGTFEYQKGVITESEEGQCSDLVNIIGEWEFQENETAIRVVALYEKDDPSNEFNSDLFTVVIRTLEADRLVVGDFSGDITLELRPR